MKYSKAIELIQNTFEFEGLGMQMRYKDAMSILDALIEAGMLPPFVDRGADEFYEDGNYWDLHIDGACYAGQCKWEPE